MNAETLVRQYYRVMDELGSNPETPLSELESVATSIALDSRRAQFERERDQGWRQTGTTELAEVVVRSVNLHDSADRVPTVEVDVCWDVTNVDVVDDAGSSVVSPDRPDRGWSRHMLANHSWGEDPEGGWRVSSSQTIEQEPCETTD